MLNRPADQKHDDDDLKTPLAAQLINAVPFSPPPILPSPVLISRATPLASMDIERNRVGYNTDPEVQNAFCLKYFLHLNRAEIFEFMLQTILIFTMEFFIGYVLVDSDKEIADDEIIFWSSTAIYAVLASIISLYSLYQLGPYNWNTDKLNDRIHFINDLYLHHKDNLLVESTLTKISNEIAKKAKFNKINLSKQGRIPKVNRHTSCAEFFSVVFGFASDFGIGVAAGISINNIFDLDEHEAFHYLPAPVVLGLVNGVINLTIFLLVRNQKVYLLCRALVAHAFDETLYQKEVIEQMEKVGDILQDKLTALRTVMNDVEAAASVLAEFPSHYARTKPPLYASQIFHLSPTLSRRSFGARSGNITPNSFDTPPQTRRVAYSKSLQAIPVMRNTPVRSLSNGANTAPRYYATFNVINSNRFVSNGNTVSSEHSFTEERPDAPARNCWADLMNTLVGLYPIMLAEISTTITAYSRVQTGNEIRAFYVGIAILYSAQLISVYWRTRQYGKFDGVGVLHDFIVHSGKKLTQSLENLLIDYKTRDLQLDQIIEQANNFLEQVNVRAMRTQRGDSGLSKRELIFDWLYEKNILKARCCCGLFAPREDLSIKVLKKHFERRPFNGITFLIYWTSLDKSRQDALWDSYVQVHPEAREPAVPVVPTQLRLARNPS